jgi:hypothetical protein
LLTGVKGAKGVKGVQGERVRGTRRNFLFQGIR